MRVIPPTDDQKYSYVKTNRGPFYTVGIFSFLCLMGGLWLFVISHHHFYWYGIIAFISTFYLGLSYLLGILGKDFDLKEHQQILSTPIPSKTIIDVFLPSAGEDLDVLKNTYTHVGSLNWPHVNVYVLDDSGRPEVHLMAQEFGFEYMCRPNRGELKKAGNLRYAFPRTDGEFIIIFDADFCPRPDFITETLPYFFYDPKVAIVQTPQFFEIEHHQTWVEKGAAFIQELFYRLIQVNRNTFGGSICVGTNAIYRRSALEPFGGTAAIGYSEDVHTGFNCLSLGYKIIYVPLNLAKGICPDALSVFFVQQYRWAMGSITLFFNPEFWVTELTFMQRVCYLSGMFYYMVTGVMVLFTSLPSILLIWFYPEQIFWYNLLFSLPSLFFGTFFMAYWSKEDFGMYAVKSRTISYYAHLFAFIDKLRNNMIAWVPSGNAGATKNLSRFQRFRELLFWWNSLTTLMIVGGIFFRVAHLPLINFIPILFFTVFNYYINMSILRDQ